MFQRTTVKNRSKIKIPPSSAIWYGIPLSRNRPTSQKRRPQTSIQLRNKITLAPKQLRHSLRSQSLSHIEDTPQQTYPLQSKSLLSSLCYFAKSNKASVRLSRVDPLTHGSTLIHQTSIEGKPTIVKLNLVPESIHRDATCPACFSSRVAFQLSPC